MKLADVSPAASRPVCPRRIARISARACQALHCFSMTRSKRSARAFTRLA